MAQKLLGNARVFASHYQIVICDDPMRIISDAEGWNDLKFAVGFAGNANFRVVGTEADLNDHWVELIMSDEPPEEGKWQRITCVDFRSESGSVHVMSVVDDRPPISASIPPGDYAAYFAAQNLGVDQLSLGEEGRLRDEELAARTDLEWYRVILVPGKPKVIGRIVDKPGAVHSAPTRTTPSPGGANQVK